jgi:uncharacterized membrane protein HdeD (DUF308 family)
VDLALRGVLAILFGVAVALWPWLFWLVIVYVFAAYALIDGVLSIYAAATGHGEAGPWWALLLEGLMGIAIVVLIVAWPPAGELALLILIAAWSMTTGVLEIAAAVRLGQYMQGAWLLGVSGVLSILLGLGFALFPVAGLLVTAWWIAAWSIAFGAFLIVLAFRLRSLVRQPSSMHRVPIS